jgi:hypothetical protein
VTDRAARAPVRKAVELAEVERYLEGLGASRTAAGGWCHSEPRGPRGGADLSLNDGGSARKVAAAPRWFFAGLPPVVNPRFMKMLTVEFV